MILSSPGFTERLKPTGPRDTTFNNVGYMYLGGKTARQADGKILIISSGSPGPGQPTGLITRRFNEDGTRDTTFGDQSIGGIIFIPSSTATEFFLRDNGRLLVVANNPASITQYLADGSPDPTFASQGAYTNAGSRESSVSAVFSLPDGKTLAAGGHGLMRFQENGDLDTTFGELGKVTVFETVDRYKLVPAAMQADGKILMANDYPGASEYARKISVRRFQPDGSKDTSFGLNGQIEITSDVPYEDVVAIKMQPDGKILVAARSYQGSSPTLVVFRLDQSGHYDSTFSGDGIAVIPGLGINDLTLQADGKIVGVGGFGYSNLVSFRLLENGELDQAFGTAGKVPISLASANAIALQSDGKIVIGGTDVLLIRSWDFTLTRLNPNGTRDTGFGVDGFANIAVTNRFDEVKVLRVLPDDRILAVGYSGDQYTPNGAANNDFTIVRLEPSGAIDQTWGNQGIATADLLGGDVPYAMDIDSAGRIVVGGESHVRFTVARFLTARTTFSVSGRVVDPAMRGIRAASVVLTDSQGVSRTVTTSTFGYFAFENVPGGTITISVNSRRYRFTSQKLSLADDLTELLFEGSE